MVTISAPDVDLEELLKEGVLIRLGHPCFAYYAASERTKSLIREIMADESPFTYHFDNASDEDFYIDLALLLLIKSNVDPAVAPHQFTRLTNTLANALLTLYPKEELTR